MKEQITSDRRTARTAGVVYLLVAITAPFGLIYVPGQLFVRGDSFATAESILSNEFLFRMGVVSHMVSQVFFLLLALLLYKLLKQVNQHWARVMVVIVVISLPLALLSDILNISGLIVLKDSSLTSLEIVKAHEVAWILFKISTNVIQVTQLHWGLWLFPFGILVYRSQFIPRIFGILLAINGFGYVLLSISFVLVPESGPYVSKIAMPLLFIGEFPMLLWLLIKGVREIPDVPRQR